MRGAKYKAKDAAQDRARESMSPFVLQKNRVAAPLLTRIERRLQANPKFFETCVASHDRKDRKTGGCRSVTSEKKNNTAPVRKDDSTGYLRGKRKRMISSRKTRCDPETTS